MPFFISSGNRRQSSFGTSLKETMGTNTSTSFETLRTSSSKLYCAIGQHEKQMRKGKANLSYISKVLANTLSPVRRCCHSRMKH